MRRHLTKRPRKVLEPAHIPPQMRKALGKSMTLVTPWVHAPRSPTPLRIGWYSAAMLPAPTPRHETIAGRYVRLEPLAPSHAAALFEIGNHPEWERIYRYLPDERITSPQHSSRWIAEKLSSSDPLFFVCVDTRDGRVKGRQALMRITPQYGVIEIGNILWGPEMAQSRLATEALFLAAQYVFDELGYRRFEWKCDALNEPSRRAALRFGFDFEGIFRQHMWVKGKNRDTAWYAIVDRDWPELRAAYERWLDPRNFDDSGRQRLALAAARRPSG
jgi:RimJ/RimL family protein N-acetyltransferase